MNRKLFYTKYKAILSQLQQRFQIAISKKWYAVNKEKWDFKNDIINI